MTFSIVGRDAARQHLGVAIATARPAVGGRCLLARAGLVVATQGWVDTSLAHHVDALLRGGASIEEAADAALAADPDREIRQLLVLASTGPARVHGGTELPAEAAGMTEPEAAAAGNQLASAEVPAAMLAAFNAAPTSLALAERLLRSLQAGESAGGDRRGRQSAALRVVPWQGAWPGVDLRVDDHPQPIRELERLLGLWRSQWDVYDRTGTFPPAAPASRP
jgi:uncharacterized Ntn-hydrolase superfamily protein